MKKIIDNKIKETAKLEKLVEKNKEKTFDLIVTIVNRGFSDYIINAATEAGASGSTTILGRGTGVHENEQILGIRIQPEKEIVLTIVFRDKRNAIMKHICEESNLNKEGKGICFSLPINNVAGISHLIKNKK